MRTVVAICFALSCFSYSNLFAQKHSQRDTIYSLQAVDRKPEFKGGDEEMYKFLSKNLRYPPKAIEKRIEGTVLFQFIINADGSIGQIQTLKAIGGGCDEEALRVLKKFPKWTPAIKNGIPVSVDYKLPIKFKLGTD